MKKLFIAMTIACVTTFSAFAIDLSIGGLIDLSPTFGSVKVKVAGVSTKMTTQQTMMGGKFFFDAQYVAVLLGVDGTVSKYKTTTAGITDSDDLRVIYFNIGLLGKYPFTVGIAKLYPMLGFDFDIATTAKFEGVVAQKEYVKEFHRYWFDIGFGADVFVLEKLFIRPQLMLGFQMNKSETVKKIIKNAKAAGGKVSAIGMKFNIGVGVGYQF